MVKRLASGRPILAIWVNANSGVTFRVGTRTEFIKVAEASAVNFGGEVRRLRWAARYVAVPRVLGHGVEGNTAWLHTRALPGLSAVHPRWLAEPEAAIRAIGSGLRMLHDRLPVRSCPFDWSATTRIAPLSPAKRAELGQPPAIDQLVVCHGDACSPNTLIDSAGHCCGHVDIGDLGVADRWADLAVATLALQWNYPGHDSEANLLAAYGVDPDPPRIDYYRRLWRGSRLIAGVNGHGRRFRRNRRKL